MRILLTNDDGMNARGLSCSKPSRATSATTSGSWRPTEEQSGAGHSLTLTTPVRLRQHDERRFSVTGTPTDAVMLALAHVMKDSPPDVILSGINRGANLAEDVTYSGTVSAAMEGALAGVRSIALSQAYSREGMGDTVPFAAAEAWAERVIAPLLQFETGPSTLINVNFPALPPDEVKGIRVCRQGIRDYGRLVSCSAPTRGDMIITGSGWDRWSRRQGHSTDLEAIADGYVSVSPLHLDLTHDPVAGVAQAPPRVRSVAFATTSRARGVLPVAECLVDDASHVEVAWRHGHWRARLKRRGIWPAAAAKADRLMLDIGRPRHEALHQGLGESAMAARLRQRSQEELVGKHART